MKKIIKHLGLILAVLFAVAGFSAEVYAKEPDDDEEGYKVNVSVYTNYNGEATAIEYEEPADKGGYVYIDLTTFNNMTVTGYGTKLVSAKFDGIDVTDQDCIDEKLTVDKDLTVYVDTVYENRYNFFDIDGKFITQKKEAVNVGESASYEISKYTNADAGLNEDQSKVLKIYGYAMTKSDDPVEKPDPKKDTIYKPGDTVTLDGPKNFNVIYERPENFMITYEFNGTTLSPKSSPTYKWKEDMDYPSTFEKKPFNIKLGIINGIDIFSENDFYVAPLTNEGYKFVGWKESKSGKIYENGSDYELVPDTEPILEQKDSKKITFIAQWEEETEPEPEKNDYKNEWVDGKWYNADGTQTYKGTMSWKQNAKGWWIEDSEGWYPKSQWQKIDGKWYYFCEDGYMDYSEYREGCWLGADGAWVEQYSGGVWKQDSKGWWYEDASGWYPKSQWVWIDGVNYQFGDDGYWVEK